MQQGDTVNGVTEFVFEIQANYRVFLLRFPVAKVTYYATIMTASCLEKMFHMVP